MKILLIEDDVPVAEFLRDALCDAGHEAFIFHSGEEALRHLDREQPDFVFLDVALPGMDGIAVLREIRSRDPRLPVIVFSGFVSDEDLYTLLRLGVQDVIFKSDTLRNLPDILARLRDSSSRPN